MKKMLLIAIAATFSLAGVSMVAQAALPISSVQTSDFDSVISSPPLNDIDPPNNVIDDLTYEEWRHETVLAPSPGIISRNTSGDGDISTTQIRIRTADGSRFSAISIDFSAASGGPPSYNLALYGYTSGGQVPGNVISRSNILPGTSETLSLNWDNVDEIRVVVDSDFIVFDNLTVGPAVIPDGCDNVNGVSSPITTGSINSLDPLSWQAGETVSGQVTAPTGGATTAELLLGGSVVDSATIPGTLSYELPADIDANYEFRLNTGSATWELSCAQPASPPGFSKNFLPTQIQAGQTSRLDFIIANTTSVVAVTSLDFTDNLPAGVLVASPPNASTSCIGGTLTAVAGTGTVSYTGGTVPAQLGCAAFVDVTSANSGTYVNTSGDLTSSAGNSGTSTATLTVSPFPATIGGLLTGLVTGDNLVLQNNAGDDLTLTADGAFTFATPVNSGDPYAVTVLTQPTGPSETCTVTNGSGTTPAANVDTVSVTCSLNNYSVGGSVSGIAAGGTVVLQNNGADSRSLSADGFFTFSPQADGTNYAITVSTQPTDQTCTVTNGSGTLAGSDITNASVTCVDSSIPPPNGGMPKAVPVMPLWLYGLMFTLIAGIGGIGFKRRL